MWSRSRRTERPASLPNTNNREQTRTTATTHGVEYRVRLLVHLCLGLLMACNDSPSPAERPVRTAESLRAEATQAVIGASSLAVEVEAWRSYQPIKGDAGDPMIAIIRLTAAGEGGVPGDVGVDAAYLVRGNEVVVADAREEQPREAKARTVEFIVREGPQWTPGDSIDVVVVLKQTGGQTTLVRAPRTVLARVS